MKAELDVQRLLDDVAAGDTAAWEALVDEYGEMVWAVARGVGLDAASAADVTQTVWLRLHQHVERIREPRALPGWLATTSRREAIRVRSRAGREVPVRRDVDVALPDHSAEVAEELETADRRRRVAAAIQRLSATCRELLRLLTVEPRLSYDEIAETLDRPRGSIGPTRGRCLDSLRAELALS